MPDFVPAAAFVAFVYALINTLKYLSAKDWTSARTQLIVWAAGVGGAFVFAQTAWAAGVEVGGVSIAAMSSWDLAFFGLTFVSGASVLKDYLKARDNTQSAATPSLGGHPEALSFTNGVTDAPGVEVGADWEADQRRAELAAAKPAKTRRR